MHKIHGTYCAALTPLKEDYSINKELFLEHCNYLLSQNLDGLAIFGTTGEANSLVLMKKLKQLNIYLKITLSQRNLYLEQVYVPLKIRLN